jgi:hypothetical protein
MNASTSTSASFISLASFGIDGRNWSATSLQPGRLGVVLGKGGGDEGGDHAPPALACMGERIAHEVDTAALPAGGQHLRHRGLDALVGIRDHQLDATQPAPSQLAQELGPERLGFRRADIHAQHLAPSVIVDADGDDGCDRYDAAIRANLHIGGVDPQIRFRSPRRLRRADLRRSRRATSPGDCRRC